MVSILARQVVSTCHIFSDLQVLLLVIACVRIWFATSYMTIIVLGKDYVDDCNEFFNQGAKGSKRNKEDVKLLLTHILLYLYSKT